MSPNEYYMNRRAVELTTPDPERATLAKTLEKNPRAVGQIDRQIPEILRESLGLIPGIARFHPGYRPV